MADEREEQQLQPQYPIERRGARRLPLLPQRDSNPLVYQLRDINYYCRARRIGQYINHTRWDSYTIMVNKETKTPFVLGVTIPAQSLIVICKDQQRKYGMAYRIRTNLAIINSIFIASPRDNESSNPGGVNGTVTRIGLIPVNEAFPTPDVVLRVNDELNYNAAFDINPTNLCGRGLYVHPTRDETNRALRFRIARDVFGEDGFEDEQEQIAAAGTFNDDANYLPQWYERMAKDEVLKNKDCTE